MAPQGSQPSSWVALVRNKWFGRVINFVIVPLLVIAALCLPPFSIPKSLFHLDYPLVTPKNGATLAVQDGTQLTVPAGAVSKNLRMRLVALSGGDVARLSRDSGEVLAIQSIPTDAVLRGSFYRMDVLGAAPSQGTFVMPLPADAGNKETLDLYGWDGTAWRFLPSQVSSDGKTVRAEMRAFPRLVMLAQSQGRAPRTALYVSAADLAQAPTGDVKGVSLEGFTVSTQGQVQGSAPAATSLGVLQGKQVLLTVSNRSAGVLRSDLVDNLLVDAAARQAHIQSLVTLASPQGVTGIELAYAGIDTELKNEFSLLVKELSAKLHAASKVLAVSVERPVLKGGSWNSGAYNWQALGASADVVRVPSALDPAAYASGGEMDKLLAWAVGQIDRRKIELVVPSASYDVVGESITSLGYAAALKLLAKDLAASDADGLLLPGEAISVTVPALAKSPLQLNSDALVYWFNYQDGSGKQHTVWLENASSIARKLQAVSRYNLGGLALQDVMLEGNERAVNQVLAVLKGGAVPSMGDLSLLYTVEDGSGKVVGSQAFALSPAKQPAPTLNSEWTWTAPNNPGNYVIRAAILDDGGKVNLGAAAQVNVQVPTPTFTPTPTNTPTPTPTNTPRPTNTPVPTAKPAVPAVQAAVAPAAPGIFGYGIQADLMSDGNHQRIYQHIKGMGFNWVKQQVEWFRFNSGPGQYDWGALDRIVDGANANGINILFSVVKAPRWARPAGDTDEGPPADPNTYATFMREMAARYKGRVKAYEVWNEQNLYYEWGGRGRKLNAGRYVQLLAAAYGAIKSADPGAIVISGALTPTGVDDGDIAIDDRTYLEQMYQAGLARYCDAVGAHPSGYNNPPDADWRNWSDPSAPNFKGHPSFFFRGTMEGYRNIMIKYGDGAKRIWPTEFGWASVESLGAGPAPGYGYAADNSEGEQAAFLTRAYQMGRNWGFVGVMFLWNLNFGPVSGKNDEKAAFGIVRPDWGPRPAYTALRDMPK